MIAVNQQSVNRARERAQLGSYERKITNRSRSSRKKRNVKARQGIVRCLDRAQARNGNSVAVGIG